MPYYSDELIEQVRAANDIVDVISDYVELKKQGRDYKGLCPFHGDKNPSFSVSRDKQMYYCFACHAGGNVFTFLEEYDSLTFPEAMQVLADRARITLPQEEMTPTQRRAADTRSQLREIHKEAATYYYRLLRSPEGAHAWAYFTGRGLSSETMKNFGLGYADQSGDGLYRHLKQQGYSDELLKQSGLVTIDEKHGARDRFWNRVMFPIMDEGRHVIAFGGRVMGDGQPKYVNSPETAIFTKGQQLYGLHLARRSRRPGLLLCEGYMDVIALHQAGFDNALAALGTAFTEEHAVKLRRYTQEVYLTFDSDEAGVQAALRAIPILRDAGIRARVVDMRPHKDPDEFIRALGAEAYQERIDRAESSFMFEVRILSQGYDLSDPDYRTRFTQEVSAMLLRFTSTAERENYMAAIARDYDIPMETLRSEVGQASEHAARTIGPEGSHGADRSSRASDSRARAQTNGEAQAQALLFTWMADDPAVFRAVAAQLTPADFVGERYREVAEILYEQHAQGQVMPAQIVSRYSDGETQREVAAMFQAERQPIETTEQKEKALTQVVRRILERRSRERREEGTITVEQQVEERKRLEQLRITIS